MANNKDTDDDLFVPEGDFAWRAPRVHQPFKENDSESDPEPADQPEDNDQHDDYKEDPALYCICRGPEKGLMLECEGCKDWMHGICVGVVSQQDAKMVDKYFCPNCEEKGLRTTFKGAPDFAAQIAARMAKERKRVEQESLTQDLLKNHAPVKKGVVAGHKSAAATSRQTVKRSVASPLPAKPLRMRTVATDNKWASPTPIPASRLATSAMNRSTPTPLRSKPVHPKPMMSSARAKTLMHYEDNLLKSMTAARDDPMQIDGEGAAEGGLEMRSGKGENEQVEVGGGEEEEVEEYDKWVLGPSEVDVLVRTALEAALFGEKE